MTSSDSSSPRPLRRLDRGQRDAAALGDVAVAAVGWIGWTLSVRRSMDWSAAINAIAIPLYVFWRDIGCLFIYSNSWQRVRFLFFLATP